MKSILFFVVILLAQGALGQLQLDRQQLHNKAADKFLSTHFFENGRGMTLSPDLSIFLGSLKKPILPSLIKDPIITQRYGFIRGKKQRYAGVFRVNYKGMDLAVLGCTACHSGRAAGILIPGLGNKTIDPFRIGKDLLKVQKIWGKVIAGKVANNPDYKYVHEKAMNFAGVIADNRISNLTRGLVPDSVIKTFFYKDQDVPYGSKIERTQVKVPSLWGFKQKREIGVFADGSLSSKNYAWAFGAELFASDSGDHLRASMPKLIDLIDNTIVDLLPPQYPYDINDDLAEQGQVIVQKNCFSCHGQHNRDAQGHPIFEAPKLIPHNFVLTDKQRLEYAGKDEWVDLAESGSVSDLISFNHDSFGYGYFAPKLWGIWSRFPYLHNGSVPSLYQLLSAPQERPEVFSMKNAGEAVRFDRHHVGLDLYYNPAMKKIVLQKAKDGDRNLYYTKRPEHSNEGHYFPFMENFTEQDRMAVIEYLKTL